jgi:DNA repair exonuclease SbcCD ATPase subunit
MKVKIKDYQVIKDIDLDFDKGLTAIVGTSNNGKSSILRAIEGAIFNKGGASFINYDADYTEVQVGDIIWHKDRDSGKSFYNIGGVILNKIGQQQIDEVADHLNMKEVLIGNEKVRLNFWKQMDYPFLVGKTPFQLFEFISKSKEQELVNQLKDEEYTKSKKLKEDISKVTTTIDIKKKDIINKTETMRALEKYNEIDVKGIEDNVKEYNFIISSFEFSDVVEKEINDLNESKSSLDKVINNLDIVLNSVSNKVKRLENIESLLESHKDIENSLGDLKIKISDIDFSKFEESSKKLNILITQIQEKQSSYNRIKAQEEYINKLSVDISNTKDNLEKTNKELNLAEEELGKFDICPLCGSQIAH